jgi:hypothetical protein
MPDPGATRHQGRCVMARMKDCPECRANDIRPEDWAPDDGPYPTFTPREQRKEHSWCGLRVGGGAGTGPDPWSTIVFSRNGEYVGMLIHHGRKAVRRGR